jgi:hypothetical protein
MDGNGKIELYEVDVYEILIEGTDETGNPQTYKHLAPRFMPYWNNPKKPYSGYKTTGWVNAGLSEARNIIVTRYIRDYQVHNRYSPGKGAIVIKDTFYIHAGPADLEDVGFGSAGCVEIIGDFDVFKSNIQSLSGYKGDDTDDAIDALVKDRNLSIIIQAAKTPDIKANFTREI